MIKLSVWQGHRQQSQEGEPYSHLNQAVVAKTGLEGRAPGHGGPEPTATASPCTRASRSISGRSLCCLPYWDPALNPGTMKLQKFWTGLEYTCRLLGITTAAGKTPPPSCSPLGSRHSRQGCSRGGSQKAGDEWTHLATSAFTFLPNASRNCSAGQQQVQWGEPG